MAEKKAPAAKAAAPKAAKAEKAPKVAAPKNPPTPPAPHVRGARRSLVGVVRSDKMDKTVVVEVVTLKRDPVYGKYLKNRTRYKAHDEKNEFHTGDRVEISEHRPLSRGKRFEVTKLIERAKVE